MVLVPATMELLGDANWWLPRWLDRLLPNVHIEGEPDLDHEIEELLEMGLGGGAGGESGGGGGYVGGAVGGGGKGSRGRLCPKGSATFQLVTGSYRQERVLYRRPGGTEWEPLALEDAMDMVAARVQSSRDASWDAVNRRTLAFAHLGGATLDNEENYLIKKLFTALGAIQIENQARI